MLGDDPAQLSIAHPKLVGSASGRPQLRRHLDGEFHLFIGIAAIVIISPHRRV
jgi:hypothetical protein